MNRKVANTVIACVAFVALVAGLTVYRMVAPAAMSRDQLSENGLYVYETPRRFDDFNLVDHDGDPFTAARLKGAWTLVFFGYTFCPDICPVTMAALSRFAALLEGTDYAADTRVVMVTVDPRRDTREKLKQYVGYFDEDFLGVTGEYSDIFNLTRQLNVAFNYLPGENGDYLVSHSGQVILIDPAGHNAGFFKSPHDPQQMRRTYTSLRESF